MPQSSLGGNGARFDALFLDFDGVILESADIKTRAFTEMYRPYGDDVLAAALAHHKAHGGISRRQKIRHCHATLLGRTLTVEELDRLALHFSHLVEDAVVGAAWVPGAEALLASLRDRLPMFVVSGTPEVELRRIVARRGIADWFHEVRGSPPEKPPIIRELLADHGLAADRVLFVGDSMTDHDAAAATGLAFVGRVRAGEASFFPAGTTVISDLTQLEL